MPDVPANSSSSDNDELSPDSTQTRRPRFDRRPRLGTKICLLIAVMLVVGAAWFYWTPLSAPTSNGSLFDCRSAFQPPGETFSKNACGNVNRIYQFRALVMLIGAVAVAGVGTALFGFSRPTRAGDDVEPPQG